MANKYKRISRETKKTQDNSNLRMVMGLLIVAVVALGVFFAYGSNQQQQQSAGSSTQSNQQQQVDVTKYQQTVTQAESAIKATPNDYTALVNLGNAYYDLGNAYYSNGNETDSTTYYAKAVDPYQKALQQKFDIGVQTDMATAAFYGGKSDIAEAAFKTAIEKQPDFLTARFNYGVFLFQVKQDKAAAKQQMDYVANQTANQSAAQQAQQFTKQYLQ